ncbi:hypothetical protein PUMCH_000108 [Australozyma saopauloensis]|uniref:Glycoside hydrolase family 5 domain-containing protein n=1 Tax=Australozyma saopauloensis TaxID=291208 RepID=A0AAX4H4H5_9ASCO|nr:hypothetical protein PUMCH_000108 [[Candida] saopauloensis]
MQDPINISENISDKEFVRYRTNFGVNLGGCFVREKWMFKDSMIGDEHNGPKTELQALKEEVARDRDGARDFLENHWQSFMNDDDWKWIQSKGMNSVRVPIGYWNIDGGNFTGGTKFADYADIYRNSWQIFKSHFIEAAARFNISVLVDVHALPGGANKDSHSGEEHTADFWSDEGKQGSMVEAVRFIARDLKGYSNVSGIQVVNEAFDVKPKDSLFRYYESAMRAIREEDDSIPVVISDGWWTPNFTSWIKNIQGDGQNFGFVLDAHCYRMFSEGDQKKSAQQITDDLEGDFVNGLMQGPQDEQEVVDLMLGEYSCVLSEETWRNSNVSDKDTNDPGRKDLAARFGRKQVELALKRTPAAIYFWSYKFPYPWGEWDARVVFDGYIGTPSISMPQGGLFEELRDNAFNAHVDYWTNEGHNFDFERYKLGYEAGWSDCFGFAERGAMLGRRIALNFARKQQHIRERGDQDVWQFTQGYNKATKDFAERCYRV